MSEFFSRQYEVTQGPADLLLKARETFRCRRPRPELLGLTSQDTLTASECRLVTREWTDSRTGLCFTCVVVRESVDMRPGVWPGVRSCVRVQKLAKENATYKTRGHLKGNLGYLVNKVPIKLSMAQKYSRKTTGLTNSKCEKRDV